MYQVGAKRRGNLEGGNLPNPEVHSRIVFQKFYGLTTNYSKTAQNPRRQSSAAPTQADAPASGTRGARPCLFPTAPARLPPRMPSRHPAQRPCPAQSRQSRQRTTARACQQRGHSARGLALYFPFVVTSLHPETSSCLFSCVVYVHPFSLFCRISFSADPTEQNQQTTPPNTSTKHQAIYKRAYSLAARQRAHVHAPPAPPPTPAPALIARMLFIPYIIVTCTVHDPILMCIIVNVIPF